MSWEAVVEEGASPALDEGSELCFLGAGVEGCTGHQIQRGFSLAVGSRPRVGSGSMGIPPVHGQAALPPRLQCAKLEMVKWGWGSHQGAGDGGAEGD